MHSASIIICAYSDLRREQVHRTIRSVEKQTVPAADIIVVIDHNPLLLRDVAAEFPHIRTMANRGAPGLSGARNTGIHASQSAIAAFLDDDAVAEPDWIERMIPHYDDERVIGVGGRVVPMWQTGRPRWFPEEFQWVVGCSYLGQPESLQPVRNPIGCNMSFRRSLFDHVGGFREGLGRTGADAAGCEETELCIRAQQALPGSKVLYDPWMVVHHEVTSERSHWRYLRKRCLAEGRSKKLMARVVGTQDGLSSEQAYVSRVLTRGVLRSLGDVLWKRDPWGFARAGGIVAGLGLTAAGYMSAHPEAPGRTP